jgi:protein TonB
MFVEGGALTVHADLMFEKFVASNVESPRQRPRTIAAISVAVHAGFLLGLLVHGFWQVERLGMPRRDIQLAVATALPPPPAAPAPSVPRPPDPKVRVVPRQTTQPVHAQVEPEIEIITADLGSELGVAGGSPDSQSPFTTIGTEHVLPGLRIETPPPAPAVPTRPAMVAPTTVEARRVAGHKLIQPDHGTKLQMARDGRQRVQAVVKMCLSARGEVVDATPVQSSGYPEYDALIVTTMQAWKYQPYLVDNQPAPVCTQVTFIYQQY